MMASCLAARPGGRSGRADSARLGSQCRWLGLGYRFAHFGAIDPIGMLAFTVPPCPRAALSI
jgi:hypothetical protein